MKKPLHLIYIPDIGDAPEGSAQAKFVRAWRWWGVESEVFEMNWGDNVPWTSKLQNLLKRIDVLAAAGRPVALVAASAGASAAINAFAVRRETVTGVVCIAGKVNRPEVIGQRFRRHNPAFVESVQAAAESLQALQPADRRRILNRYAVLDTYVAKADSHIAGARNRRVPSIGHFITIATQISLGAPGFIRFLKRCRQIK
jgi:pimeloyl-ACP methyl ester carboxylesterase